MKSHKKNDSTNEPIRAHSQIRHESKPHTLKPMNKHTHENIFYYPFHSNYCPNCHRNHSGGGHVPKYKKLVH